MFSSNTSQVSSDATYIEDVFSTWLYTGNDTYNTITNGIDLAGEGGLVWLKRRDAASSHVLVDTERGAGASLFTNTTGAQQGPSSSGVVNSFNSDGFTLWVDNYGENVSGASEVSWTFRKQPKFFDVVTYTGDGSSNRQIAHDLGVAPGCIIVKCISHAQDWMVYHRSLGATQGAFLNLTNAAATASSYWNNTEPTATNFTVGFSARVNEAGYTYVAYLFAHDAGGFGDDGLQNVVSCGSYTGTGSDLSVTLGYEPQWLLVKNTSSTGAWVLHDVMRGMPEPSSTSAWLLANATNAEAVSNQVTATATGFKFTSLGSAAWNASGQTYIYIAIRRGPMKTPTSGTSVYNGTTGIAGGTKVTTGFPVDMQLLKDGVSSTGSIRVVSRLTGVDTTDNNSDFQQAKFLLTAATDAEGSSGTITNAWDNTGFKVAPAYTTATMQWSFERAPGFFDVVCYTGTGSATTVAHNLGVAPELMIVKSRSSGTYNWMVYSATTGATQFLNLNTTIAASSATTQWNNTSPTTTVFTVGTSAATNSSGGTYVAYLFASCPGVSKCGSYTGTGTTQQINCGFTAGARFVLIKRTDSTGDWYVWDSARGIVAGNDPYLLLNSTAAEDTSTDYVDSYSAGFEISSTAPAAINASGGSFIFLAIA